MGFPPLFLRYLGRDDMEKTLFGIALLLIAAKAGGLVSGNL